MLELLKVRFPNIPWPQDINSTEKSSYSEAFLAALKAAARSLVKEERLLTKEETALVILERRIEVSFTPELTKKKAKVKTPKLNELAEIDCTNCSAKTGVWKLIGETVLLNVLQLRCTECDTSLSEPFNILRKTSKKKASTDTAPKKTKTKTAADESTSTVFKPSAKQLKQHKSMKAAFSLGVGRSSYSLADLELFDSITEFLGEDE